VVVVTVHLLEAGVIQPRRATLEVIRRIFEAAGVELIDEKWRRPRSAIAKEATKKGVECGEGRIVFAKRMSSAHRLFCWPRSARRNNALQWPRDRGRRTAGCRDDVSGRKGRGLTSDRKIKANRMNARASTGPKTTHGRAHAARNALRHALNLSINSFPVLCEEMDAVARKIVGTDADAETLERARRIAEAEIDLRRVRLVRHQLLSEALSDPNYEKEAIRRLIEFALSVKSKRHSTSNK
jgi:hypothetical protein